MTALLVLSVVNIAGSVTCLALLILRRAPAPMDPAAIARAILSTPHHAAEIHEAIDAQPTSMITTTLAEMDEVRRELRQRDRIRYLVQHTHNGVTKILYEGTDSDRAYVAHTEMETHPDRYPGRHQYLENGRARVDRLHSEIES